MEDTAEIPKEICSASFPVHFLVFCVECPYVAAFLFFSQQDVIIHQFQSLQDHRTQICQAVAPCIKMFPCWLVQDFVPANTLGLGLKHIS